MYFVPGFIALVRKHNNVMGIFVLNLLLGWSLIGWIVALIWSLTANTQLPPYGYYPPQGGYYPPPPPPPRN